jgi:hypothetical protein
LQAFLVLTGLKGILGFAADLRPSGDRLQL